MCCEEEKKKSVTDFLSAYTEGSHLVKGRVEKIKENSPDGTTPDFYMTS